MNITSCQFIAGLTQRDKQPHTNILTPIGNLRSPCKPINIKHFFGLWEETEVAGVAPHGHEGKCKHQTERPWPGICEATKLKKIKKCKK